MSAEVHSVLTETKGKRFILSPSAGPYEETISPHVVSNYHAFLDAARSVGNGTRQGV